YHWLSACGQGRKHKPCYSRHKGRSEGSLKGQRTALKRRRSAFLVHAVHKETPAGALRHQWGCTMLLVVLTAKEARNAQGRRAAFFSRRLFNLFFRCG